LLTSAAACSGASSAGDPAEAFRRGVAALEAGQPRTARIELMNAVQANPNDGRARVLLARTYVLLGDGVAAESELRRANQGGVPAAQTKHLLAHALLLQNQPQRAIEEASGAAPEHAGYAARIRGRGYMASGDHRRAAQEFARALEAAPGDSELLTDVARFRRSAGDLAGALRAADAAVLANARNAQALTLRGELTRGQYGLAAAIPWFDRALEIDGNDVTALLERARTNGDLGRMRAMLADSRRVLEISPGHPAAYYLQAMLAARGRDYQLARAIYERTEGRLDHTPAGMLLASAIEYQAGSAEQAVQRLERLLALLPANRKVRRLLAAAQWRKGDAAAAIATLRPMAVRPDADSYTLSLTGRAYQRLGDTRAAAFYLARAAQPQRPALTGIDAREVPDDEFAAIRREAAERPGYAPAQIALVAALLGRGLGGEALQRARELQAAHPGTPVVHVLVGDALGIRGDFRGAAEQYRKAANLAFTEPVALRMIEALQRSNQGAAAERVLSLFVQQNPRNVPALVLTAGRHMQARNWAAAIQIYEGLRLRLGDRDATILNNLAWAYSEQGDYRRAVPIARRAHALDRSNPAAADTLGWILYKSGSNRAEGLALLERAARGAPSDSEIRLHLERARRS
jgi:tetratricopeptide (TPR) repeat protein